MDRGNDALTMRLGERSPRRGLLGALALLTGAGLIAAEGPGANAKKKRKKKKKCENGTTRCGKRCVDLATDNANCGSCGNPCSTAQFCDEGACRSCDVCESGCAFASVQAAVDAAGSGATIQLCPEVFAGPIAIAKSLTVRGAGAGKTLLDGQDADRVLMVDSGAEVSLHDLSVVGGRAHSGGGIVNSGTLALADCIASDNTASGSGSFGGNGGGILNALNGSLTMTDCTIRANDAGIGHGGGLFNSVDSTMSLTRCTITRNTATTEGGGFSGGIENLGTLTMSDCTVSENEANAGAGGINNLNSLTMTDCIIRDNRFSSGAGIFSSGPLTMTGCSVRGNESRGEGGGIFNTATLTMIGCTVTDNQATASDGGGINNNGTLTMTDCTIKGNKSGFHGGGIASVGAVLLQASHVTENSAVDQGGGIMCFSGAVTLKGSDVTANTSNVDGGGIFNRYGTVTLEDESTVTNNDPNNCVGTPACGP